MFLFSFSYSSYKFAQNILLCTHSHVSARSFECTNEKKKKKHDRERGEREKLGEKVQLEKKYWNWKWWTYVGSTEPLAPPIKIGPDAFFQFMTFKEIRENYVNSADLFLSLLKINCPSLWTCKAD